MEDQQTQQQQARQVSEARPVENNSRNNDMQTLIPTKNMHALLSYYAGVFGIIPFLGLPASVAAIILGKSGLKKYRQNPTPGAKGHALVGLGLGIFELVVFTLFLASVFLTG